jgi:creatinine amidohydrolase/Fe(II)-dependent formamide hydrolase-like protein
MRDRRRDGSGVDAADPEAEREAFLAEQRARAAELGLNGDVAEVRRKTLEERDINRGVRRKVGLVSLGNALEAHGMALAPDIDDRIGAAGAVAVANRTGARYLGHVPFATDGIGDVARAWSPAFMPFAEFYNETVGFVRTLLAAFYTRHGSAPPDLLVLVSGHGGNAALAGQVDRLAHDLGVPCCQYAPAIEVPDGNGLTIHHCGTAEHSVAMHLGAGCVDRDRLERANADMAQDEASFLRTLRDHPDFAGMAGFYVFGGARFDAVRARYPGLKSSVRDVFERRRVDADAELGRRIFEYSVAQIAARLLDGARALGIDVPERG